VTAAIQMMQTGINAVAVVTVQKEQSPLFETAVDVDLVAERVPVSAVSVCACAAEETFSEKFEDTIVSGSADSSACQ